MESLIALETAPAAALEASPQTQSSEISTIKQAEHPVSTPKEQPAPQEPPPDGAESCVLKLKGLPYSAGEGAIREFFSGYTIKEVAFVYEPDGRPSGLAFAEFATREEALQAMSKNGAYIGERYVRLLHVPKQEMQEQVRLGTIAIPGNAHRRTRFNQQQHQNHMRGGGGSGGGSFDMQHHSQHHMQLQQAYGMVDHLQLPHGAVLQAPARMIDLQGYTMQPAGPGGGMQMVAAAPNGGAPVVAMSAAPGQMGPQLVQVAPGSMAVQMGPGPGGAMPGMAQILPNDRMQMGMPGTPMGVQQMQMAPHMALAYQLGGMTLGGPQHGHGGPQHMQHHHQQPHPQQQQQQQPIMAVPMGPGGYAPAGLMAQPAGAAGGAQQPVMVIGTDSKTVKIRGLPFRATPLDIFNFFEGYNHIVESLQLGVDALGRPSGEAWLTFTGCDEALRAVRERNRHYLGNRYLELSLT